MARVFRVRPVCFTRLPLPTAPPSSSSLSSKPLPPVSLCPQPDAFCDGIARAKFTGSQLEATRKRVAARQAEINISQLAHALVMASKLKPTYKGKGKGRKGEVANPAASLT